MCLNCCFANDLDVSPWQEIGGDDGLPDGWPSKASLMLLGGATSRRLPSDGATQPVQLVTSKQQSHHGIRMNKCRGCARQHYSQRMTSTRVHVGGHELDLCTACKAADARVAHELAVTPAHLRVLRSLQTREITPDDYDALARLRSQPPKCSDSQVVQATSHRFLSTKVLDDRCVVCMEAMDPGQELCMLTCEAQHVLHAACATGWFAESSGSPRCPIDQCELS